MPRFTRSRSKRKRPKFSFETSPSISLRVKHLISECALDYIAPDRVFCVESEGSTSRAYARIWGLPRIWQSALKIGPAYVLEVTHRYQKLSTPDQDHVLMHELAHIPKNFSGALLGHNGLSQRVQEMKKRRKA